MSDEDRGVPTWLAFYDHAVVRLSTYVSGGISRLVFASVELLAPGRPAAETGPLQERRKAGVPDRRLFFRQVAMGAAEALTWYRDAMTGSVATPVPWNPSDRNARLDGLPLEGGPWIAEPPWPNLALDLEADALFDPSSLASQAPFIGTGAAPARFTRLMASPQESLSVLMRDESAMSFLHARLHLDLTTYLEFSGGLALVVPDPIVRRAHLFVRPRQEADGTREDVVLHLLPRGGANLSDLQVTLTEMRAGSLCRQERLDVPRDGFVVWTLAHEVGAVGFTLTHAVLGTLRHQAPKPFLRRTSVTAHLATRRVTVHAAKGESPGAGEETYEFTEYVTEPALDVGNAPVGGQELSRIVEAQERRRRVTVAGHQGQHWLDNPDAARVRMRSILGGASRRVWIADPYLGGRQLFQFVHAVGMLAVEIRLMTSRLAFVAGEGEQDGELRRLAGFEEGLRTLSTRGLANVEAGVLRGKSPPLHDRFLIVDGDVWFTGSSLNALGSRASLIVKLPDPDAVVARWAELWASTVPFRPFLASRIAAAARRAGSSRAAEDVPPG